jgi:hypothetical protein
VRLDDVDNGSADLGSNISPDEEVLGKFRKVARAIPYMNVSSDVGERFRRMAEGFAKLFEFKNGLVDVVAVVEWDVSVDGLGAPYFRGNVDGEGTGSRAERRQGVVRWNSSIVVVIIVQGRGLRDQIGQVKYTMASSKEPGRREVKRWGRGSGNGVDSTLKEAQGHIVASGGERRRRRSIGEGGDSSRRGKATSTSGMVASRSGRVEGTIGRETKSSSRTGNRKIEVQGAAVHGIGTEGNDDV